jgi:hypothetical protein
VGNYLFLIKFVFVSSVIFLVGGCGESISAEALKEVRQFYKNTTIKGNKGVWQLRIVTISDSGIHVRMIIPHPEAIEIMSNLRDESNYTPQKLVARTACPPKGHNVWKLLNEDLDVEISVRDQREHRDFLIRVSCRKFGG